MLLHYTVKLYAINAVNSIVYIFNYTFCSFVYLLYYTIYIFLINCVYAKFFNHVPNTSKTCFSQDLGTYLHYVDANIYC